MVETLEPDVLKRLGDFAHLSDISALAQREPPRIAKARVSARLPSSGACLGVAEKHKPHPPAKPALLTAERTKLIADLAAAQRAPIAACDRQAAARPAGPANAAADAPAATAVAAAASPIRKVTGV
jgi:hypothetical protein